MDVERGYRDSRINRIFEGTNEINRLLVVDTAMKRAMKGEFDLFGKAEALVNDIDAITDGETTGETFFNEKTRYIRNFKKAILLCIHGASKQFDKTLVYEQEIMNNIAEMMMETYISESLSLRVNKLESLKGNFPVYRDILDVNIYDTAEILRKSGYDAINSFASPEAAPSLIKAIDTLTRVRGINVKEARRRIADKLIVDNSYKF
jgi:alkylation response protein AidB-like acyl-CoA dehydrogenase